MQSIVTETPWGEHLDAPYGVRIISLTKDEIALVDEEDYAKISVKKWQVDVRSWTSYARRDTRENGERIVFRMHREIANATDGLICDHKNGNGLDNRKRNLRLVSQAFNNHNRHAITGASRFRGVFYRKRFPHWRAQISLEGQKISIGDFPSEIEAAFAYDAKAMEVYGEHAATNF